METRCAPFSHLRGERVYGHATTVMHGTEYTPAPHPGLNIVKTPQRLLRPSSCLFLPSFLPSALPFLAFSTSTRRRYATLRCARPRSA